ncbi:MAG: hypothetical protein HPY45_13310 [Anaerolineae bacterium]|nr:hypothetical protein [Anaerolineae bacterium]
MCEKVLRRLGVKFWRMRGWDTLAGEWYALPGIFLSEGAARRAARRRLKQLEKLQPSRVSGGQDGVQDQVFLVCPDGMLQRIR